MYGRLEGTKGESLASDLIVCMAKKSPPRLHFDSPGRFNQHGVKFLDHPVVVILNAARGVEHGQILGPGRRAPLESRHE